MHTHRALILGLTMLLAALAPLAIALFGPTSTRPAAAQSSKMPSACTLQIAEAARAPFPLCETAEVTVTLGLTCPARLPFHVVFVVARHLLMEDHLDDAKSAARGAADEIAFFPDTQVGVVSLSVQERVEQDLTNKEGSVLGAISRIRLDNVNPTANYYDWLGQAGRMLEKARADAPAPPIEAVLLYSTGCPTGFDNYCNRQIAAAAGLKSQGITLIGVCNPNARPFGIPLPNNHCRYIQQMASDGYYFDLQQGSRVNQALAELQNSGNALMARKVALTEWLAPGLALVPGSGVPAPEPRDQRLDFAWADVLPGTTVTATYRVQPSVLGRVPLRTKDSQVIVTDKLDRLSEPLPVPLRELEVVPCVAATPTPSPSETPAPTATPLPPTATATPDAPPTATATRLPPTSTPTAPPSPTAEPNLAFLPLALQRVCKPAERSSDVVLLIDASSSMSEVIGPTTKLAAAQAAAWRFIEIMRLTPGADRAAVVAFNSEAAVAAPLTHDREALRRAIDGVAVATGTRIDRAIERAAEVLFSAGGNSTRQRVVVLLTDGRPDGGTVEATLAAADSAKSRGALLFIIGLGDDVDADLLGRIASQPDGYFPAPDAAALRAIYEGLAAALPCPGGTEWGER